MTKQRDLKALARARAEKLGTSYTTARAAILNERERDTEARPKGCLCHLEAGDSPCPLHGDEGGCPTKHGECILPMGHRSDEHGDDHQQRDGTWWNVGQSYEAQDRAIVADLLATDGPTTPISTEPPRPMEMLKAALKAMDVQIDPAGALSRYGVKLKTKWTPESFEDIVGDLKAFHGLDGEGELARVVLDAVFAELTNLRTPEPTETFEAKLIRQAKEMAPKPFEYRPFGPAPTDLWRSEAEETKNLALSDPSCVCGPELGGNLACEFHHPPVVEVPVRSLESVDVARKLVDRAIAARATDTQTVVRVDTTGMTPAQATEVLVGTTPKCPPVHHGVCVYCGRMPHACECKADPPGTTYARCTNCDLVYKLYPTKSRTCEHCHHHPVEVIPVTGEERIAKPGTWDGPCSCKATDKPVGSSGCGSKNCMHYRPGDDQLRYEVADKRYVDEVAGEVARGVIRVGDRVLRGEERAEYMRRHHIKPLSVAELEELKRQTSTTGQLYGDPNTRAGFEGHRYDKTALDALPPVPAADLVPMLEALKYINSGDAHADEAKEEASEALEAFDKKHPKVLTALMDPRDDEDFDPEERIECIVNGETTTLPREADYRTVVQAAGYDGERVLSVTYRKGKHVGGILHVGEPILVERKMIFNVADTSNA